MRVPYSPGEEAVRLLLREDLGRDSETLARLYYGSSRERPFNGRRVVVGLLSSLARKMVLNGGPLRVQRSPRRGPAPIFFWLEAPDSKMELVTSQNGTLRPARRARRRASGQSRTIQA